MSAEIAQEIYTVSHLTRQIKRLLEDGLPPLWTEGEISNYTLHRSGHRYFTLKDSSAQIPCVMWRTRQKPIFDVKNGLRVKLFGRISVWEPGGRYQFDVQSMMHTGLGPLQEEFEELKRKLAAEGLFDQDRKKPLPRFPNTIGIATSQTGAAIRDMSWGFNNRYPPAKLFLLPVSVQGQGSAQEIAGAIDTFNQFNLVDVIIIGRGGGSLEDLWAFNEEVVVRAIDRSRIPIVSAVGHEIDFSLSDFAADVRAPTPTAAAGLVVPDRAELMTTLFERRNFITKNISRLISQKRERLHHLGQSYSFRRVISRISDERQRVDDLSHRLDDGLMRRFRQAKNNLNSMRNQLEALSPEAVMNRGFCIAKMKDGSIIRNADKINVGDCVNLRFKRGRASSVIEEVYADE